MSDCISDCATPEDFPRNLSPVERLKARIKELEAERTQDRKDSTKYLDRMKELGGMADSYYLSYIFFCYGNL